MPAITVEIRMWAVTNHAILRFLRSRRSRRASICKIASSIAVKMAATSEGLPQASREAESGDDS
jgi:hypothetical protein